MDLFLPVAVAAAAQCNQYLLAEEGLVVSLGVSSGAEKPPLDRLLVLLRDEVGRRQGEVKHHQEEEEEEEAEALHLCSQLCAVLFGGSLMPFFFFAPPMLFKPAVLQISKLNLAGSEATNRK